MSETTDSIKPMTDDEVNTFIAIVIVVSLLVLFLVIFIQKNVVIVRQASVMIIERWGQFHAVYKPGFHFIIPFMETARCINWRCMEVRNNSSSREIVTLSTDRIDLREHVIDFGRQHVITHDTVEMYIDALVYFRIVDARLAVLEIQNLPDAVELLTQATLRNVISNMTLDDTFSSREKINHQLLQKMRNDAERWGVEVTRVEIFNLDPANDVKEAMEKQIKAERERRAMVLQADGVRQSRVIRSRGDAAKLIFDAVGKAKAAINDSKGRATEKELNADAQAKSLTYISQNLKDKNIRAVDYLTAINYLKTLSKLDGNKTNVVLLPTKTVEDVATILGEQNLAK